MPWLDRTLLVVGAVPVAGDTPALADESGAALPLAAGDDARLQALSGGHPLPLSGEWDGYSFVPCYAFHEHGMTRIGGAA